jgi:hypothetical protein
MEIFARRFVRAWIDGAGGFWEDICFACGSCVEGGETAAIAGGWHQIFQICSDTKFLPGIADDYYQNVARDIS